MTRVQPDQTDDWELSVYRFESCLFALTQVLHILIGQQLHSGRLWLSASLEPRAIRLEDHYAVRGDRRQKSGAVAELSPAGIVVEGDVGQAITGYGKQQGEMANKPTLEQVSELQILLLKQLTNCRVVANR